MKSFGKVHVLQTAITVIVAIAAATMTFIPVHLYISHAAEAPKVVKNHILELHNISSEPSDSTPSDWPQFHGDVARDSYQPTNTVLNKANATTLITILDLASRLSAQ
jgi:hypothetical protein